MRISAKAKAETRGKILDFSSNLFKSKGFQQTTTRDIARAAGIAAGTLFNYFATKEELALALIGTSLEEAEADFQQQRAGESLDELLFAHVAAILRHLQAHRAYAEDALRICAGKSGKGGGKMDAERIRTNHLNTVTQLIGDYGETSAGENRGLSLNSLDLHLYWILFLGVLNFWARDESPHQEETLALLDQSMKLLVESLTGRKERDMEVNDE